jgi:TonB-dependent SusC/RagA subfamily outer membrane receptor
MIKQIAVGAALLVAACSTHPAPASFDDEMVNTGYGTQPRRAVGGAVSTITRKDIEKRQPHTVIDMIRSHVPGAQIIQTRDGFSIQLRGMTSIYGSNSALVVLDGLPLSEASAAAVLGAIRPEEVMQIDVLKDATASIYGVRGANGVVVITTRR